MLRAARVVIHRGPKFRINGKIPYRLNVTGCFYSIDAQLPFSWDFSHVVEMDETRSTVQTIGAPQSKEDDFLEFNSKSIYQLVRARKLAELQPMLMTLISQGRPDVVERFISSLKKYREEDWNTHKDPGLANSMLKAYLDRGQLKDATKWKDLLMDRKLKMSADALTYAILFKFLLSNGTEGETEVRELGQSLCTESSFGIENVLQLEYLTEGECNALIRVMRKMRHPHPFIHGASFV